MLEMKSNFVFKKIGTVKSIMKKWEKKSRRLTRCDSLR